MERTSMRDEISKICGGNIPSVLEIAQKLGFKEDRSESSRNLICMRIGSSGGGEKILVNRDGKSYKNTRSWSSGDAVALSIEFKDLFCHYSNNWKAFFKEWKECYGTAVTRNNDVQMKTELMNKAVHEPFNPDRWEFKPLVTSSNLALHNYLRQVRCIDSDILTELQNSVKTIKDLKYGTHNGRDIVNIGFPLYRVGENTPCGFEIKNVNFKRTAPGSDVTNGMWFGTQCPHYSDVKRIFFFESAIDALSYASIDLANSKENGQPRKLDFKEDILVSCAGGPKLGQLIALKKACPNAKAIAAFDLDAAGQKNDIILNNLWSGQTITLSMTSQVDKLSYTQLETQLPEIKQKMSEAMANGYISHTHRDGSIQLTKRTQTGYNVNFNGQQVWLPADDFTLPKLANALKDYRIIIDREKPARGTFRKVVNGAMVQVAVKDWNDRIITNRQEKQAKLAASAKYVGRVQAKREEQQAAEQAKRDEQIAKANERLAERSSGRKL
ncbi:toprim domain-containing protein [Parabacteroides merdae]|uniref:toprim domain-containing protein n=3 Tax=Parabacteroides merdae TaxID=46503 RepID=UPI0034A44A1D